MTFEKLGNHDISQHVSIIMKVNVTVFPRDNHYIFINVKTILICSYEVLHCWSHYITPTGSSLRVSINMNINVTVFPRDNHYIFINVKTILIRSYEVLLCWSHWERFIMTPYASDLICMSNICATAQPTMTMLTHSL